MYNLARFARNIWVMISAECPVAHYVFETVSVVAVSAALVTNVDAVEQLLLTVPMSNSVKVSMKKCFVVMLPELDL